MMTLQNVQDHAGQDFIYYRDHVLNVMCAVLLALILPPVVILANLGSIYKVLFALHVLIIAFLALQELPTYVILASQVMFIAQLRVHAFNVLLVVLFVILMRFRHVLVAVTDFNQFLTLILLLHHANNALLDAKLVAMEHALHADLDLD